MGATFADVRFVVPGPRGGQYSNRQLAYLSIWRSPPLLPRSGPVGRDGVAVRAGRAAEAPRAVAGEVEDEAFAAVVGAHRKARELVGPDHVDHRHRRLDRHPLGERSVA